MIGSDTRDLLAAVIARDGIANVLFALASITGGQSIRVAPDDARRAIQLDRAARRIDATARAVRHWLPAD